MCFFISAQSPPMDSMMACLNFRMARSFATSSVGAAARSVFTEVVRPRTVAAIASIPLNVLPHGSGLESCDAQRFMLRVGSDLLELCLKLAQHHPDRLRDVFSFVSSGNLLHTIER